MDGYPALALQRFGLRLAGIGEGMSTKDIVQIRVNGRSIGVIGLTDILMALEQDFADRPDEKIIPELLRRVEAGNYIPSGARAAYGEALVREFRKHCGQAVEEEIRQGVRVVILGPGCARCDQLERDVREVMAELNLAADLQHVNDAHAIARYGLVGVPALIINDTVVAIGTTPHRHKIKQWLVKAVSDVPLEP